MKSKLLVLPCRRGFVPFLLPADARCDGVRRLSKLINDLFNWEFLTLGISNALVSSTLSYLLSLIAPGYV